jgi:hypothetical protein
MDKPIVPDKITVVIDPVSKPVGLIKDIAKGIDNGFKTVGNGFKQFGNKLKKAFTVK